MALTLTRNNDDKVGIGRDAVVIDGYHVVDLVLRKEQTCDLKN